MPCQECGCGYLALSWRPCWNSCWTHSFLSLINLLCPLNPSHRRVNAVHVSPPLLPPPATHTRVFILGPGDILLKIAGQRWCKASLFIPSHWLTVKVAESIGLNYVDSVSRPMWQKTNWYPTFFIPFFLLSFVRMKWFLSPWNAAWWKKP